MPPIGTVRELAGWLKIPATDAVIRQAAAELTLPNPEYRNLVRRGCSTAGVPEKLAYFGVKDGYVYLPRESAVARLERERSVVNKLELGAPARFTFKGKLTGRWSYQQTAVEALAKGTTGVLQADCGAGKTTMLLASLPRIGRATLIVVHTEELLTQWIARIEEFLGIPKENVAVIRGPRCNFEGASIGIALLQSLAVKEYPPAFYRHWGVVAYDEGHHIAAKVWLRAVTKFPSARRYVLSATPTRADGMHKLIHAHVGPVLHVVESPKMPVKVLALEIRIARQRNLFTNVWNRRVNQPKLLTVLASCPLRNQALLRAVQPAMKAGRRVLVISHRIDQLAALHDVFVKAGYRSGVLAGHVDKADRQRALAEAQVICAISQYGQEGLDVPSFDTLLLATPISASPPAALLQQIVGRIQRYQPDKRMPIVIDPVDLTVKECASWWVQRCRWYRNRGYEITRQQA